MICHLTVQGQVISDNSGTSYLYKSQRGMPGMKKNSTEALGLLEVEGSSDMTHWTKTDIACLVVTKIILRPL